MAVSRTRDEQANRLGRMLHGAAKQTAAHRDVIAGNSLLAGIAGYAALVIELVSTNPKNPSIDIWLRDLETLAAHLPSVDSDIDDEAVTP